MPQKKKTEEQLLFTTNPGTGNLEIHVMGRMLPCGIFSRIVERIKQNGESSNALPVVFVVYSREMLLQIRETLPRECYTEAMLRDPQKQPADGGYLDAVGM